MTGVTGDALPRYAWQGEGVTERAVRRDDTGEAVAADGACDFAEGSAWAGGGLCGADGVECAGCVGEVDRVAGTGNPQ